MIRKNRFVALWSVPFVFILLLTGCKDSKPGVLQGQSAQQAAPSALAASQELSKTLPEDKFPEIQPKEAAVSPNDKVSLASAVIPTDSGKDTTDSKTAASKPKIDIQDPYNQAKPTLLGLTLNASVETVTGKYGKPKSQFVMEDETDPITVYEYANFLVGFNKKNQLEFIDIRSSDINPGLNGLKLGQTTSDAFKALGKPDSNTSFVLTYKSTGAILKLDIDPKTETVNSIKLFAAQ